MTAEKLLPASRATGREAAIELVALGCDINRRKDRKTLVRDTADLAAGLTCLFLFLGAVYFSELDSNYATSVRMTAAIQHALGIHRSAGASATAATGPTGGARSMILVAATDDGQRLVAKTTLERYGYAVALADTPDEAVSFFREASEQVALVLLDESGLPDAGRKTIERLKRIRKDVRILVCFAPGDRMARNSAARGWIEKPLSAMPLASAVRSALSAK